MNTKNNIEKRAYSSPQIERIQLDNEISLILQSDVSPAGEPVWLSETPEHFTNDPFNANRV